MAHRTAPALYQFANRRILPRLADLTAKQVAALPGGNTAQVTHMEYEERQAFGNTYYVLLCWLLGRRKPLAWRQHTWQ
jgi:hypothetical protein